MQSFVPKNRRPRFELLFRIIDLNNVPLVSGSSSIKWHLDASGAAEHRGRTPKCSIKDHKVVYNYEKKVELRLIVGKDGVLQESTIEFEILQEYQTSGHSEKITLGVIKLNLAEYVITSGHQDQAEGDVITRRYLMQQSKINSTLKIDISMTHLEGDKNYTVPALRFAPVFGGIAGIMSSEVAEIPDEGHMPSLTNKSRETGELQDMYRRTLAASWAAQPGEPRADDCIEDIFAGGDGWGNRSSTNSRDSSRLTTPTQSRHNIRDDSDDESLSRDSSSSNLSSAFSGHKKHRWSPSKKSSSSRLNASSMEPSEILRQKQSHGALRQSSVAGRTSLEAQARKMDRERHHGGDEGRASPHRERREIDEFKNPYKEDLRSWRIREKVI